MRPLLLIVHIIMKAFSHELRLPLTCVDDAFWLKALVLRWRWDNGPPSIDSYGRHLGRCSHDFSDLHDRRQLFAAFESATCESGLVLKLAPFGGWLANLHAFIKPLMYASARHAPLLSPSLLLWIDRIQCPHRDLTCFFEPLSQCDGALASHHHASHGAAPVAPALPSEEPMTREVIMLTQKVAEHRTSPQTSWVHQLSRDYQATHGTIHPRGWFWWTSNLLAYVLRPTARFSTDFQRAMNLTGLRAAIAARSASTGGPVLGLHVRHGDACGKDAKRAGRTCEPLAVYMRAVRRLSAGLDVRTIYLATDSEHVLAETRGYPEYTWIHFDEALRFSKRANPNNQKWDYVLKRNKESAVGGGAESMLATNMRLAALTTIDVMLLSQCDLFVGKFSSNFFRAAYELKSATCDCASPFESLDHPWCFDWLEPTGGSGNMTYPC